MGRKRTVVKTSRGTRIIYGERRDPVLGCGCWPLYSDAFGVLPEQVKEASENAAKAGVPTEFKVEGDGAVAVFRDRKHMLDFYKYMGCFDRTAGYRG